MIFQESSTLPLIGNPLVNLPRFTGRQVKSYNQMIGGSEDMEGIRRQYSYEFKKDAVGHSMTSEKSVEKVARDLGVAHSNLKEMACPI